MRIGVISDTHDLLRSSALAAFESVDHIVHLGDVCRPDILTHLGEIAPVNCVLGNCDSGAWTAEYRFGDTFRFEELLVHACHIREEVDIDPLSAGVALVLSGHSHQPSREVVGEVTYFNPGSAGPRRFRLPVSLAVLEVDGAEFDLHWVDLD